jgi:hypothetical protein
MTIPSLRKAREVLKEALAAADDWHADTVRALPDNHTWRDLDLLEIERSTRHIAAYDAYGVTSAEFSKLVEEDNAH